MIKAVFFDLDNTLYDFECAMRRGLTVALQYLFERRPNARGHLCVERLIRIRDRVAAEAGELGLDLKGVRVESFRRALKLCGHSDDLAPEIAAVYFKNRFRRVQPFEGSLKALRQLRGRYVLGILSNGNTAPEDVGLDDCFDHVIFSEEVGAAKPDARIFEIAMERVPCLRDEFVYVGDTPELDVAGAKNAGACAVWFNPYGRPYPEDVPRADFEIADLSEIVEIVERLDRGRSHVIRK